MSDWYLGQLARQDPDWPDPLPAPEPSPHEQAARRMQYQHRRLPQAGSSNMEAVADALLPKEPWEYALMAAAPGAGLVGRAAAQLPKAVRAGALAAGIGTTATEAQADKSKLAKGAIERVAGFAPGSIMRPTAAESLFDYSRIRETPDVKQFDLPRFDPPRGVSERVERLITDPKVAEQMLEQIEKGKGMNAQTFYYNEPLREAFIAELGRKRGEKDFARYMDYVAGTSPRSDVETNARNASYYYWLEKQGLPVPPKGGENPQPYGHMAQNLHRENARKIRSGEYFDYINNPKPLSFSQNLQGNYMPVTVDAHAFKLPAMLARDPEFLAGSYKPEKGAKTINPTKMFERGDLTMGEAYQRPVYWASRPNPNEYGAMEQYYKMLASEAGIPPAPTQGAAWASGGEITGLGSVAGDPFMRSVENRAIKTAKERGITKEEALSQMMRGKAPLLGLGGTATMGGLAARDEYRQ